MRFQNPLIVASFVVGFGGLIMPTLAQTQTGAESTPDQSAGHMDGGSHMGGGMMSRGGMSSGMVGGGCSGMMQSMNGGDGRPNSQWRTSPPNGSVPN